MFKSYISVYVSYYGNGGPNFYHHQATSVDEIYEYLKDCQADLEYNYGQSYKKAFKTINIEFARLEYNKLHNKYNIPEDMKGIDSWYCHRSEYENFNKAFSDKELIKAMFNAYNDYYKGEN